MTRRPLAALATAALAVVAAFAAGRDAGRADTLDETQRALAATWGRQWQAMNAGADADAAGNSSAAPNSSADAPEAVAPEAFAPPAWMPASVTRWGDLFVVAGAEHGVDPVLLAIVALVESGGNPYASSGVAYGLMQIHPPSHPSFDRSRQDDPAYSAGFGAYVMADNMRACAVPGDGPEYVETIRRAAARYNGGQCTAHLSKSESRAHARWTAGMWQERHDATSPTYEAWMAAGGQRLVMAAE